MRRSMIVFITVFFLFGMKSAINGNEDIQKKRSRYYLILAGVGVQGIPLTIGENRSSSDPRFSFGIGIDSGNRMLEKQFYWSMEYRFFSAGLSDVRITQRTLIYHLFCFSPGYYLFPKIPMMIYGTLGLGWQLQSNFINPQEIWFEGPIAPWCTMPSWKDMEAIGTPERMDKKEGIGVLGLGVKWSPIRNIAIRADFLLHFVALSTGSVTYHSEGSNWVTYDSGTDRLHYGGYSYSMGMELRI